MHFELNLWELMLRETHTGISLEADSIKKQLHVKSLRMYQKRKARRKRRNVNATQNPTAPIQSKSPNFPAFVRTFVYSAVSYVCTIGSSNLVVSLL